MIRLLLGVLSEQEGRKAIPDDGRRFGGILGLGSTAGGRHRPNVQ